jgi:hypothetical protein
VLRHAQPRARASGESASRSRAGASRGSHRRPERVRSRCGAACRVGLDGTLRPGGLAGRLPFLTSSVNGGSEQSSNVSTRRTCKPAAFQIRAIVVWFTPVNFANTRELHGKGASRLRGSVSARICSIFASLISSGRPRRGASNRPSSRLTMNRCRHLPTVCLETSSCRDTCVFVAPREHSRTMRARKASVCLAVRPRAQSARQLVSSSVSCRSGSRCLTCERFRGNPREHEGDQNSYATPLLKIRPTASAVSSVLQDPPRRHRSKCRLRGRGRTGSGWSRAPSRCLLIRYKTDEVAKSGNPRPTRSCVRRRLGINWTRAPVSNWSLTSCGPAKTLVAKSLGVDK